MDFYEELKNKKPFIYEDHQGLVVVGKDKVARLVPAEYSDIRCDNWLTILNESQNENERKKAYKNLINYASLLNDCNKNKIALKDYLDSLTKQEIDLLKCVWQV